jgi:hypothetical protein
VVADVCAPVLPLDNGLNPEVYGWDLCTSYNARVLFATILLSQAKKNPDTLAYYAMSASPSPFIVFASFPANRRCSFESPAYQQRLQVHEWLFGQLPAAANVRPIAVTWHVEQSNREAAVAWFPDAYRRCGAGCAGRERTRTHASG